jgi:chemotaxis family two-component system response regulator Rcp1
MQLRRTQHLRQRKASLGRRRLKVLLVEPNMLDARLIEESFRALNIRHQLKIVRNNTQVTKLLTGHYSRSSFPDLVLIGVSGREQDGLKLLTAIRANRALRTIPVIILATSSEAGDVSRAYELGANAYLSKPADDFVDLIGDLDRFWFRRAELPSRASE